MSPLPTRPAPPPAAHRSPSAARLTRRMVGGTLAGALLIAGPWTLAGDGGAGDDDGRAPADALRAVEDGAPPGNAVTARGAYGAPLGGTGGQGAVPPGEFAAGEGRALPGLTALPTHPGGPAEGAEAGATLGPLLPFDPGDPFEPFSPFAPFEHFIPGEPFTPAEPPPPDETRTPGSGTHAEPHDHHRPDPPPDRADRRARTARGGWDELSAEGWTTPVSGYPVSAAYGQPGDWAAGHHTGVDFATPVGTTVRSVGPGTVVTAGWSGDYGNLVVARMADDHYTLYAHLSEIGVGVGQSVLGGTTIGATGNTGNTTGPHLHFEVRAGEDYGTDVDPLAYLAGHGVALD